MSGHGAPLTRATAFAAIEGLSLVVGFLTQPLLMRALGPAAYGDYALAIALGVVAVTVTDFGFNFAGVVRAVELAGDPVRARRHFWAVQGVKLAAGLGCVAAGALWSAAAGGRQGPVVLTAMVVGLAAAWGFPSWFLMARQKLTTVAISLLLARVLGLLGVWWWVQGPQQVLAAVVLTLGAPALAGLMACVDRDLRAQLRPCRPNRADLRDAARSGLSTLWLSGQGVVSAAVVQSLLIAWCGSAALGLYAAADRVRGGLQGLFTAFGAAVFPRLVQDRVQGDAAAPRMAWSLLRLQLLVAALGALALLAGAPAVVAAVSGPAYAEAVPVLRVLALALLSTTLLSSLGLQLMVPQGHTGLYSRATLLLLLLQAGALAVLAPAWGALGAAWALLLCEGAVGLVLLRFMRRRPV